MLHLNTHIFKHKNPGSHIILIARKSRKMFQSIKMYITQNEANRKFITEKSFSRKVLIFPDFPDIQSKFPDNSLIYRLAVNPGFEVYTSQLTEPVSFFQKLSCHKRYHTNMVVDLFFSIHMKHPSQLPGYRKMNSPIASHHNSHYSF